MVSPAKKKMEFIDYVPVKHQSVQTSDSHREVFEVDGIQPSEDYIVFDREDNNRKNVEEDQNDDFFGVKQY